MKKILYSLFAVVSLTLSANAQDISFILQGGYQGANLTKFEKAELANGLRVGVALDWEMVDLGLVSLSLQPGVNFSQKGTQLPIYSALKNLGALSSLSTSDLSDPTALNALVKMNYIDIPLLLNARIDVPVIGNVFLQAGPYVAFGIGSSTTLDMADLSLNLGDDATNFDLFKDNLLQKLDWGLQFGGGIEIYRFILGAGYQLGLKDVVTADKTIQDNASIVQNAIKNSLASGTRNSSFYVSLGFRF